MLLTGGSGYVGSTLIDSLLSSEYKVIHAHRNTTTKLDSRLESICYNDLASAENLLMVEMGIDVVIHLAARVHVMAETSPDPLQDFREVNVLGTLNLAKQAAESGVKRFIFISSIKVNGESTRPGKPFVETDEFIPTEPYGLSKYEAEKKLLELSEQTGMEVVIIRPPLIYGPGVKANFLFLLKLLTKHIPLPFGNVDNKRSFVAIDNLVSFIILCTAHPKAANQIFLISDGEDVSTTELIIKIGQALGKKPFLLPVPTTLMKFFARLIRRPELGDRLFGSLQVDSSKARDLLGWRPVITMDEQLQKTVDAFLK